MNIKRYLNKFTGWYKFIYIFPVLFFFFSATVTSQGSGDAFTFDKYKEFLRTVSDTARFRVLPLNEFQHAHDSTRVLIGLRHDIDADLLHAFEFSEIEYETGIRSTYFILHTASYYLEDSILTAHNENILLLLKIMQDDRCLEIGWHNDLVTLNVVYGVNAVNYLKGELLWLRANGIHITGTASHGSVYCRELGYLNYYFFEESALNVSYPNNIVIHAEDRDMMIPKARLTDFDLQYEAYSLDFNKYYSDSDFTAGERWHPGMEDWSKLKPGDRVQVLIHPQHWH